MEATAIDDFAKFPFDRRSIERSDCAATALELALTGAARRAQLDAVLLVDDDGLLVSNSDTGLDLSLLAAVTPIVGRGKAVPKVSRDGAPVDMTVRAMQLHHETLYVAALGGDMVSRLREIKRSIEAVERILD